MVSLFEVQTGLGVMPLDELTSGGIGAPSRSAARNHDDKNALVS
jgi:hypothetical protein